MTTNENLKPRQTITVRMSKKDSAGGLLNETELVEVIYLQHSKRMPGFLQINNQGATQYVPVTSLVVPAEYTVRMSRRVRGISLVVTDIRLLDELTIEATELDGTVWELKISDILYVQDRTIDTLAQIESDRAEREAFAP